MDDDALASLSSKGLVRRARRDLEAGRPTVVADDASVRVRVEPEEVRFDARGVREARCTCRAAGTCRHALVALLHLREQPDDPGATTEADVAGPGQALLALTAEALRRWKGKGALVAAAALLRSQLEPPECSEDQVVRVRFPDAEVEVVFHPGGGLEGATGSAGMANRERWTLAAVLAYRAAHGLEGDVPREERLAVPESAAAPRTRAEVLEACSALLTEAVRSGIAHLSSATVSRFSTLAVSARGTRLPRLSLLLASIAEQVGRALAGHASADPAELFASLARCHALCQALAGEDPRADLVGQPRTKYDPVGTLELAGLGARAWRTASGYLGLTVFFVEPATGRWFTWSEARSAQHRGEFDPRGRYFDDGPWSGVASPWKAAHHHLRLTGARRSHEHRLSASRDTRGLVLEPVRPADLDLGERQFTEWRRLHAYAGGLTPVGLRARAPTDRLVVLRPARWGARSFDRIEQVFHWELFDAHGVALSLEVPFEEATAPVIETLEAADPKKHHLWGLMGRVWYEDALTHFEPYALLRQPVGDEPAVVSLGLDPLEGEVHRPRRRRRAVTEVEADEVDAMDFEGSDAVVHEPKLLDAAELLLEVAEAGGHFLPAPAQDRGKRLARWCRDAGLAVLARNLEQALQGELEPQALLQARYVVLLHEQVLASLA